MQDIRVHMRQKLELKIKWISCEWVRWCFEGESVSDSGSESVSDSVSESNYDSVSKSDKDYASDLVISQLIADSMTWLVSM